MNKQECVKQLPDSSEHKPERSTTALFPHRRRDDLKPVKDQPVTTTAEPAGEIKNKKAKKKKAKKALGSSKCIETMFRTAYRTQLDLTSLAATKANIMISLNGLILSVLTLSGPFVLVAEPAFTMPIAVFLATCLASIIFAVLAAQPKCVRKKNSIKDFKKDEANILIFEEFSSLSIIEHSKVMSGLMRNNKRIYKSMSRQLYKLGLDADRKFRLLKLSYMVFLTGLTVSTLILLSVGMFYNTHGLTEIMTSLQARVAPIQQVQ